MCGIWGNLAQCHTTARVSWWDGRFKEQFAGFATGPHLWVHGGALLMVWGSLRGDPTGSTARFQLPFYVWHLTAHFCHLSLQSDQDPWVWGWPTHRLRPTLTLFTRRHCSSCQSKTVNESWIMSTLQSLQSEFMFIIPMFILITSVTPWLWRREVGGRGCIPHSDSTWLRSFRSSSWMRMTGSISRKLAELAPVPRLEPRAPAPEPPAQQWETVSTDCVRLALCSYNQ